MTSFKDLGLAEPILRAIDDEGYTQPTPIQAKAIPHIMEGRDVLGIAQTGTGKTASFVLPMLDRLMSAKATAERKCCRMLVLAPTRELAGQIQDSIRTYARHMWCATGLMVGGARPSPQIKAVAKGVDILVATPGRLMDHMAAGVVRLDQCECVVLDEADQMLDMGFVPAIRQILSKVPKQRQTVLLSATMPKQIRALANDFLNKPAEVSVAPSSRPIERIAQSVVHVDARQKRDVLVRLLTTEDINSAIVFTRTKFGADKVQAHLEKYGIRAEAIHGNKTQAKRDRILNAFRGGQFNVLVATDVAARGIDVDDVTHVVNFELPNVPEMYVHRIGRTARAGRSGIAVSLCDRGERSYLRDIERLIGSPLGKDERSWDGDMPEIQELAPVVEREREPRRSSRRAEEGERSSRRPPRAKKRFDDSAEGHSEEGRPKRAFGGKPAQGKKPYHGRSEKAEPKTQDGRRKSSDRSREERPDHDKAFRGERPNRFEKSSRSEKSGRSDHNSRPEKSERPNKSNRFEKSARPENGDRPDKARRFGNKSGPSGFKGGKGRGEAPRGRSSGGAHRSSGKRSVA